MKSNPRTIRILKGGKVREIQNNSQKYKTVRSKDENEIIR